MIADRIQLDGKTYIPLVAALELSNVSEATLRKATGAGRIRFRAAGKKVYVELESFRRFTEAPELLSEQGLSVPARAPHIPVATSPHPPEVSTTVSASARRTTPSVSPVRVRSSTSGHRKSYRISAPAAGVFSMILLCAGIIVLATTPAIGTMVTGIANRAGTLSASQSAAVGSTATSGAQGTTQSGGQSSPATTSPTYSVTSSQPLTASSDSSPSVQPIYYVYNYPILERVQYEVRNIAATSTGDFSRQLQELYSTIQTQIQALAQNVGTQTTNVYNAAASMGRVEHLDDLDLTSPTLTDANITDSTISSARSLSVAGSTSFAGSTSLATTSITGEFTVNGSLVSSGTTTSSGALLASRAPTLSHTFSSWTTGAANANPLDASLIVNPATAVGDGNLFSASVGGAVKFLVDAEGDVFANNLTSVGSVTLSTTSASSFSVEGNTTLGDSITDTTTINGALVVTGQTSVASVAGNFGVGTTTPWGKLALSLNSGDTNTNAFIIASSTASATSTLFSISNTGAISASGAITSTAGSANIFPYASSTAFSIFNTAYFGGTATSTFDSLGNLYVAGNIGIGTTSPFRKFSITDTVSTAQAVVAYDSTRYAEQRVDTSGDLNIGASGGDTFFNNDNLWVCTGGSITINGCPSGTPAGQGNIIAENKIGIGTSTPAYKVTIETQDTQTDFFQIASSTAQSIFVVKANGRVGIGTTTPTQQLSISNLLFVGAGGATGLGTATSTFQGDIKITGKLDVGTIDPVYTIDGVKYATYGSAQVGVKEEVSFRADVSRWDEKRKLYVYAIDFSKLEKGSDVWLFYQVTDFGTYWENLIVTLTPSFDGRVFYEEAPKRGLLNIYASKQGSVSVRLVANRFDFTKWQNLRPDQDDPFTHFELQSK